MRLCRGTLNVLESGSTVHAELGPTIGAIRQFDAGACPVTFVTPYISACLAARHMSQGKPAGRVSFVGESNSYAENNGLAGTLRGEHVPLNRGGLIGTTYSPLARLSHAAEVEPCNAVLDSLLRRHLGGYGPDFVKALCKVVGELHDNVASHADGTGYSAAQVFSNDRLAFAIADSGRGFLRNVRKVHSSISDDNEAIRWALVKGNTTASTPDSWAQRWAPSESLADSEGRHDGNSHQGLGLALLEDLVRRAAGSMWVMSGKGCVLMVSGQWVPCSPSEINWTGVAIGLEIPLNQATLSAVRPYSEHADLGKELGL